MDVPGVSEICIALICGMFITYCLRKAKMAVTDTLPTFLVQLHRLQDIAVDVMERYNGNFFVSGRWLGTSDFLFTVDAANINYITTSNFTNYPKGEEYRRIFDVMGHAIFNSDDEEWKFQRRLLHSPLKGRGFFNHSMETARENLERVLVPLLKHASDHSDRTLDMQNVFQRFALDVVCKSLTGHDPASLSIDLPKLPFLGALADFERAIIYRAALPEFLWKLQVLIGRGPEYKLIQARRVINSYVSSIVSKKREQVSTSNISEQDDEGADLLTLLMKDVSKTQGMDINDDKFFHDTTIQQLVAGRDTTSSAMTWFIWLVTSHPEVEQKIRDEIKADIPGAEAGGCRVFNSDETSKLVYLHAALSESMRLYPPVPFQYKSPREPDVVPSGHPVHPKTKIVIPLYAMARTKALWGDNCSEFEPERWITERGAIKHEPANKFFTFYAGPRSCMGKEAAMTQMKMVAATLIHNFRFQLVEGQNIQPDVSIILHIKNGLQMKVQNRWT